MQQPKDPSEGLLMAAELGRSDIIRSLVEEGGADINFSRSEDGASALHVAVLHEKADSIRTLMKLGAKLTIKGTGGNVKDKTCVELSQQVSIKKMFPIFVTEAIQAIAGDDANRLEELLEAGLHVDSADHSAENNSLLHWAATFGSIECIKALLSKGANMRARNNLGATPLHDACYNGREDAVSLLLEKCSAADMSATGKGGFAKGKTPVEVAKSAKIIDTLKKFQTDATTETRDSAESNVATADGGGTKLEELLGKENPGVSRETAVENGVAVSATEDPITLVGDRALEERDLLIANLKSTIEKLLEDRASLETLLEGKGVIDHLRNLRDARDALEHEVSVLQGVIEEKNKTIARLQSENEVWKGRFEEKGAELERLKSSKKAVEDSLALARSQIKAQDILIAGQTAKIASLEHRQKTDSTVPTSKTATLESSSVNSSVVIHGPTSAEYKTTDKSPNSGGEQVRTIPGHEDDRAALKRKRSTDSSASNTTIWSLFSWIWPFSGDDEDNDASVTEVVV